MFSVEQFLIRTHTAKIEYCAWEIFLARGGAYVRDCTHDLVASDDWKETTMTRILYAIQNPARKWYMLSLRCEGGTAICSPCITYHSCLIRPSSLKQAHRLSWTQAGREP